MHAKDPKIIGKELKLCKMIGIVLIMHETAVTLPFISQTEQRFDVYLTAFCVFGFEQNKKKCVLMKPRPTILINDSTNRE